MHAIQPFNRVSTLHRLNPAHSSSKFHSTSLQTSFLAVACIAQAEFRAHLEEFRGVERGLEDTTANEHLL